LLGRLELERRSHSRQRQSWLSDRGARLDRLAEIHDFEIELGDRVRVVARAPPEYQRREAHDVVELVADRGVGDRHGAYRRTRSRDRPRLTRPVDAMRELPCRMVQ
jgi:hypothetical protein